MDVKRERKPGKVYPTRGDEEEEGESASRESASRAALSELYMEFARLVQGALGYADVDRLINYQADVRLKTEKPPQAFQAGTSVLFGSLERGFWDSDRDLAIDPDLARRARWEPNAAFLYGIEAAMEDVRVHQPIEVRDWTDLFANQRSDVRTRFVQLVAHRIQQ